MKTVEGVSRLDGGSLPGRMTGDAIGLGWRPETAGVALARSDLGFVEVVAEALPTHSVPLALQRLIERGVEVIPHGIGLSLGGAEPPDAGRLELLAGAADRLSSPLVSEHLAFVRAGGAEVGHLLPVPRTRDAMDVLVDNVRRAQEALPVPLVLEPIASLFRWPQGPVIDEVAAVAEMDEPAFITEVLERTGALLLLDVANVFVNGRNFGFDPHRFLDRVPLERLAYVHIAGGEVRGGVWHDTHAHPIWPEALELLAEVTARVPGVRVLLERDDDFVGDADVHCELDVVADAIEAGARRRESGRLDRVGSIGASDRAGGAGAVKRSGPQVSSDRDGDPIAGARSRLGASQQWLVDALIGGAPVPGGFDVARVESAADALRRKRARSVARSWPHLARSWGDGFEADVVAWLRAHPCSAEGSHLDGLRFALDHRSQVRDDDAVCELLAARARSRVRGNRIRPRRLGAAAGRLPGGGGLAVALVVRGRTWSWRRRA